MFFFPSTTNHSFSKQKLQSLPLSRRSSFILRLRIILYCLDHFSVIYLVLFSASCGKRKAFCILLSRFPHIFRLLPSWHVEKANLRCLQCLAALQRSTNLPEMQEEAMMRSSISNHFLIVQVLGTQLLISVFLYIYTTSVTSLSIPQSSFSHFSCHYCCANVQSIKEGDTWGVW